MRSGQAAAGVNAAGRLVGIVNQADLLKFFLRSDEELQQETMEDVIVGELFMGPSPIRCPCPGRGGGAAGLL